MANLFLLLPVSYLKNAKEAAARFSGDQPGNVYSRFTNPTVRAFEQRLCAMESGDYAVATASGMAALLTTGLALLKSGDHVVLSTESLRFNHLTFYR